MFLHMSFIHSATIYAQPWPVFKRQMRHRQNLLIVLWIGERQNNLQISYICFNESKAEWKITSDWGTYEANYLGRAIWKKGHLKWDLNYKQKKVLWRATQTEEELGLRAIIANSLSCLTIWNKAMSLKLRD